MIETSATSLSKTFVSTEFAFSSTIVLSSFVPEIETLKYSSPSTLSSSKVSTSNVTSVTPAGTTISLVIASTSPSSVVLCPTTTNTVISSSLGLSRCNVYV